MTNCYDKDRVTIGVDVGREGAIAILSAPDIYSDKPSLLCLILWKTYKRQDAPITAWVWEKDNEPQFHTEHRMWSYTGLWPIIPIQYREAENVSVIVEDTYLGRNYKSATTLSRITGAISGVIEYHRQEAVTYAYASMWRSAIVKVPPNTPRADAKLATISAVSGMVDGWEALDGVGILTKHKHSKEHICDAIGIALFQMGLGRACQD